MGELTGKLKIDERGVIGTPVTCAATHGWARTTTRPCWRSAATQQRRASGGRRVRRRRHGRSAWCRSATWTGRSWASARTSRRAASAPAPGWSDYRAASERPRGSRRPRRGRAAAVQLRRPRVPGRAGLEPGPVAGGAPARLVTECATDAPMSARSRPRLALGRLLGLARNGSYASEGSGEIGLAFATATEQDSEPPGSTRASRPPTAVHVAVATSGGGAAGAPAGWHRCRSRSRWPASSSSSTGRSARRWLAVHAAVLLVVGLALVI